ncbi:uncharacterized protein LOC108471825 [Gossypium arboreum]|uniref:uncharacterized protein LOC108471825 n=1 Tax=Gossypium arboreum TaxID=29729 RepID=UPI00081958F2|nr:uncharacterized protein LOC108471825 [Gossypium arboreum]
MSPVTEIGTESQDSAAGDDTLSQAMLRILERIVEANARSGGCGSVMERLRSNGPEVFRGIAGVTSNVAEYWMETTECIMDDLDFTAEQKLKGVISLFRNEAYQWWLTRKYVGSSYINARRREFLNLTQGDRSVAEYEADFLRLSRYARGIVATEYERCRERDFDVLVEKAKITEEVKRAESQNHDRGKAKRDVESSNVGVRPRKKARSNGPMRVGPTITPAGVAICQLCNKRHPSECWRSTGACLRCGSFEHRGKDCPLRTNQMQASATKNK